MSTSENAFLRRLRHVIDRAGGAYVVASIAGVSAPAVYGWLAGSVPYRRTITKICARLGVNEEWLLTGEGPEEPGSTLTIREEPPKPSGMADDTLASALAEMIIMFDRVPTPFRHITLRQIDDRFADWRLRAEKMLSLPQEPVKYTARTPAAKNGERPKH